MKKILPILAVVMMVAVSLSACNFGANNDRYDVNRYDNDGRRIFDVDDRDDVPGVRDFDLRYPDAYPQDGDYRLNRPGTIDDFGDNDPEADDKDRRVLDRDRDDPMFDDEDLNK
jgi:hypothetical protein